MLRSILVLGLALSLAACLETEPLKLQSVATSRSQATISWAGLRPEPAQVLETRDPRTGFAVQRSVFEGRTAFAVLDVMQVGTGYYIQRQALRGYAPNWFVEGSEFTWHDQGSTPGAGNDAFWQTFKVVRDEGPDLECASGSRITRRQSSDVVGQEGRSALLGVYCTDAAVGPIEPENAQRIAAAMQLR